MSYPALDEGFLEAQKSRDSHSFDMQRLGVESQVNPAPNRRPDGEVDPRRLHRGFLCQVEGIAQDALFETATLVRAARFVKPIDEIGPKQKHLVTSEIAVKQYVKLRSVSIYKLLNGLEVDRHGVLSLVLQ